MDMMIIMKSAAQKENSVCVCEREREREREENRQKGRLYTFVVLDTNLCSVV